MSGHDQPAPDAQEQLLGQVLADYPDAAEHAHQRHRPASGGVCAGCGGPWPCQYAAVAGVAVQHRVDDLAVTQPLAVQRSGLRVQEHPVAAAGLPIAVARDADVLAGRIEAGHAQPLEVATWLRIVARSLRHDVQRAGSQ